MIVSFADHATEDLYHGQRNKRTRRIPSEIVQAAITKLDMIDAATKLHDLTAPPGNRLEALQGDLRGNHSIRINAQWRIIFRWYEGDAYDVRIVDYH